MKKLLARTILSCSILACTGLISAVIYTLSWFGGTNSDGNQAIDGEIGLRGYYYAGDGSEGHPFEIVTPNHFYNLTRLQNLGLYKTKTWFQIGHDFGDGLRCLKDDEQVEYLDMEDFSLQTGKTIRPIGNEATPFTGTFLGNGIPIRNLEVTGYPEDIGVFGYVDYEGVIENLVLDNVTINSLGYTTTQTRDDYALFSADIDHILEDRASDLAKQADLKIYKKTSNWDSGTSLKTNSTNNVSNLNQSSEDLYNTSTLSIFKNAYFVATYPSDETFNYSIVLSSSLLSKNGENNLDIKSGSVNDTGNHPITSDAVFMNIKPLEQSSEFTAGDKDYQTEARISIVASAKVDDYTFSRVIQSYTITFHSNSYKNEDPEGYFSASINLDYSAHDSTNYHHGNNVGFIAGHVNGSVSNSYVYNSKMIFNQTGYTPIYTESDTGLIGEIGKNVINSIDPELGLNPHGDTGVINFTKIYKTIREDAEETYSGRNIWELMDPQPIHFYKRPKLYHRFHRSYSTSSNDVYTKDQVNGSWKPFDTPVLGTLYFATADISENVYTLPSYGTSGKIWQLTDATTHSPKFDYGADWKGDGRTNDTPVPNWTFEIGSGAPSNEKTHSNNKYTLNDVDHYCYYDYTNDLFYEWKGMISAEPGVFCGQANNSKGSATNFISYDRFKNDGIGDPIIPAYQNATLPWEYSSFEVGKPTTGEFYMYVPAVGDPILYSFKGTGLASAAENWKNEEAIVDIGNPKEDNIVEVKYPSLVDTDYYYINKGDSNKLYKHEKDKDTFSLYRKYLRKVDFDDGNLGSHRYPYITGSSKSMAGYSNAYMVKSADVTAKSFDSVDFLWNQLIEDDTTERGMGVFKITTAFNNDAAENVTDMTSYSEYSLDNLNDSKIVNGVNKTKVFFSTAEYDFKKSGTANPTSYSWANQPPLRATTLPSYYQPIPTDDTDDHDYIESKLDINSFNYPFSRDYNYCFEMDLSDTESIQNDEDLHYYFNNPHYDGESTSFLSAYLQTVLRDESNHHLKPGDERFGFGFIRADKSNNKVERLRSLSSYMSVSSPYNNNKVEYNRQYYPEKTIAFTIDNDTGANVSVIGKGNDITIYSNDVTSLNKNSVKPLYSMRAKNDGENYMHRYFEYDYNTNVVGETIKNNEDEMKDSGELYAHIFNLGPGDYVIGANSGKADIYYLAVQGQTNAEIGNKGSVDVGNTIDNVDFLTVRPTYFAFKSDSTLTDIRANTSFSANINTAYGTVIYVDSKQYGATRYVWFKFDEISGQPVTSFITYSDKNWYHFYQQREAPDRAIRQVYRPSS